MLKLNICIPPLPPSVCVKTFSIIYGTHLFQYRTGKGGKGRGKGKGRVRGKVEHIPSIDFGCGRKMLI